MKTEELKALGLNDEQVQKVFAMHGEDVNREKQAAAEAKAQMTAAQRQLQEANAKLEGYDPEWKQKAADAEQKAAAQVSALKADYAAENAAAGLKFSSASAKKAFLAELKDKGLALQDDGKLLGFDDFAKSYRENDPGAFLPDEKPPRFSGTATGPAAAGTKKDQANAAIRAAVGHGQAT